MNEAGSLFYFIFIKVFIYGLEFWFDGATFSAADILLCPREFSLERNGTTSAPVASRTTVSFSVSLKKPGK